MKLLSSLIAWFMVSIFVWGVLLAVRPDNLNTSGGFLWGFLTVVIAVSDLLFFIGIIKKAAH